MFIKTNHFQGPEFSLPGFRYSLDSQAVRGLVNDRSKSPVITMQHCTCSSLWRPQPSEVMPASILASLLQFRSAHAGHNLGVSRLRHAENVLLNQIVWPRISRFREMKGRLRKEVPCIVRTGGTDIKFILALFLYVWLSPWAFLAQDAQPMGVFTYHNESGPHGPKTWTR